MDGKVQKCRIFIGNVDCEIPIQHQAGQRETNYTKQHQHFCVHLKKQRGEKKQQFNQNKAMLVERCPDILP
jgi:hypothetical protein